MALAEEPLLLAEEQRAPEFNRVVIELCRSVGFLPAVYRWTVESIRAAADLVAQGRTVLRAPASCVPAHPGVVWRPLTEPVSRHPWSVLWRADDHSKPVRVMVSCAHELSRELAGWKPPARRPSDGGLAAVISCADKTCSEKKSHASMVDACARRNRRQVGWLRCGAEVSAAVSAPGAPWMPQRGCRGRAVRPWIRW